MELSLGVVEEGGVLGRRRTIGGGGEEVAVESEAKVLGPACLGPGFASRFPTPTPTPTASAMALHLTHLLFSSLLLSSVLLMMLREEEEEALLCFVGITGRDAFAF